jgi:hypothetical protein
MSNGVFRDFEKRAPTHKKTLNCSRCLLLETGLTDTILSGLIAQLSLRNVK